MRFIILFLISSFALAEESACRKIEGEWYSDTTIQEPTGDKVRHVSKLYRNKNGNLLIKGVGLNLNTGKAMLWEIKGLWNCADSFLKQESELGTKTYSIVSINSSSLILKESDSDLKLIEQWQKMRWFNRPVQPS